MVLLRLLKLLLAMTPVGWNLGCMPAGTRELLVNDGLDRAPLWLNMAWVCESTLPRPCLVAKEVDALPRIMPRLAGKLAPLGSKFGIRLFGILAGLMDGEGEIWVSPTTDTSGSTLEMEMLLGSAMLGPEAAEDTFEILREGELGNEVLGDCCWTRPCCICWGLCAVTWRCRCMLILAALAS